MAALGAFDANPCRLLGPWFHGLRSPKTAQMPGASLVAEHHPNEGWLTGATPTTGRIGPTGSVVTIRLPRHTIRAANLPALQGSNLPDS